jgi:hypothetical protein
VGGSQISSQIANPQIAEKNLVICDLRTESFYAICGFGICGHTFFADLKLLQISKYITSFLPKYGLTGKGG